ncbi:hypothetical protein ACIB24_13440 [Spongisporangium articulatum]|uniref:Uncharacterized protein n=1 Tax=Spongisporangium articulatum TaxID=3362603 RepID=A0ABW8AQ10_9ACTN
MRWRGWAKVALCVLATVVTLPMLLFLLFVAFAPDGGPQAGGLLKNFALVWTAVLTLMMVVAWFALGFRRWSTLHRWTTRLSLAALTLSGLSWVTLVLVEALG